MIKITVEGCGATATAEQVPYGYEVTLPSGTKIFKRTRIEALTQLVDSVEYIESLERKHKHLL